MNNSKTHSRSPRCALAIFIFAGTAFFLFPLLLRQARAADTPMNPFEEPLAKDQVRLLGQVGKPGAYTVGPKSTLLEVIGTAGGFSPTAKKVAVQLWRKNAAGAKEVKILDCADASPTSGQENFNGLFVVQPGDIIFVPDASGIRGKNQRPVEALGKDQIRVLGQVDKPGVYTINDHCTLLDVIRMASSFTSAAKSNAVQVVRKNVMGVKQTLIIDCNALETEGGQNGLNGGFLLQPGDIIFVPEAPR